MEVRTPQTLHLSRNAIHENAPQCTTTTRSYLLSIPPEILRYILEYTLLVGGLPNVALTCRALNPLATEILYRTVTINTSFSGFFIYQIESLLHLNHSGLQYIRNLRIQDNYVYDDFPEGIDFGDGASFARPIMEMHLRLLLRRLKLGQLREFHILTHQEDPLRTIPNTLVGQLAGVKHLSLPAELVRTCDWVTDSKITFRGLESFRLTNICNSQDFIDLWRFLENSVSSLKTLYLSSIFKHGEITGDLLSLNSIDPVFLIDLKDILPKLLAMKTSLRLTNLRSLQLFGSCHSETLNEAIPMLQPLETLYLYPYYKSHGAAPEKLSFSILNNHKDTLRRFWFEDPKFSLVSFDAASDSSITKLEMNSFPKVEEVSVTTGNIHQLEYLQLGLPINTRLLRILDAFPSSIHKPYGLTEYALTVVKTHIASLNGQKPALSLISIGPYYPSLDTQSFVSDDVRIKFLVKYDEDKDTVWYPVLMEVETKTVEERFPECDIVHAERPEGPWQPG